MKPIKANLETKYKGCGVTVVKIDPQKNAMGRYYGVTTIPTTVVIRGDALSPSSWDSPMKAPSKMPWRKH